jgi:hypothetical protein
LCKSIFRLLSTSTHPTPTWYIFVHVDLHRASAVHPIHHSQPSLLPYGLLPGLILSKLQSIRQSHPPAQMTLCTTTYHPIVFSLDFLAQASLSLGACLYISLLRPSISGLFFIISQRSSQLPLSTCTGPRYYSASLLLSIVKMCYLVVERYSVCRCLYYQHNVDMCAAYGQQGHKIQERTVLVGYACEKHSNYQAHETSPSYGGYDSGYGTASHGSHTHSSRRTRR